jgi:integral membrane sensor domain MASE1
MRPARLGWRVMPDFKQKIAAFLHPGRFPSAELAVGAMFFLSACASMLFTRVAGGISLFWPANAIAAALLIRLPRVSWAAAGLSLAAAALTANVAVAHRSWDVAVLFSTINLAEIAILASIFRTAWRFPYPDISIGQATAMVAVFGIGIPGLDAALAGVVINARLGTVYFEGARQWWGSHAVGACLFGPPIILGSRQVLRRLARGRYAAENALTVVLCMIGTYFLIRYVRFPFIGIGVLLIIAAFRVGGFGAAALSLVCGLEVIVLWGLGIRPLGVDPAIATTSL